MPLFVLLVLLVIIVFGVVISRANELFFLSIREGEVLLVRGRIPIGVRHDLEDVLQRADVRDASLRAVRSSGHSRLLVTGVDEGVAQRLRNAFGVHPVQKLRAAPIATDRNLGQVLGIMWLAWMLRR